MDGADQASAYQALRQRLLGQQCHWLVTGVAGFIGSHLLETLLQLGQRVTGLDNFLTGHKDNLAQVRAALPERAWRRFRLIEGDIRSSASCAEACRGVDFVLHQAALGSVSRSIAEPLLCCDINILGFVQILSAARDAGVRRVVYAASSASYGDALDLPKVESRSGRPLSPYALSKCVNEMQADVFALCYGSEAIGLRYFNVFGPRQDPHGAYAAVIPQWLAAMLEGRAITVNGDGETSRDFCYVANAVQANLLASLVEDDAAVNQVYNVAVGVRTSLNALHAMLAARVGKHENGHPDAAPVHAPFRAGDIRHSQADIAKAVDLLGYRPSHSIADGLDETVNWYVRRHRPRARC